MEKVFLEGLLLQASLIFALGAQNLFVLESGLKRQNPLVVSFTCFICDLSLIMLGVAGTATLLTQFHQLKILFGGLGIIFMVLYGWSKIRPGQAVPDKTEEKDFSSTWKKSIILSITFSIFNPHAYLDAIVLIGGFSTKYSDIYARIAVGLGAAFFSLIWFLALSYASSIMKPLLESPKRMRLVMSLSGVVLIVLAGKLGTDVYTWIQEMMNDPQCSVFGTCSPIVLQAGVDMATH